MGVVCAGKGILGWVLADSSLSKSPIKSPGSSKDVKVVLGNKQMMADEGIPVTKPVDDYMRDMEVSCVIPSMLATAVRRLCLAIVPSHQGLDGFL